MTGTPIGLRVTDESGQPIAGQVSRRVSVSAAGVDHSPVVPNQQTSVGNQHWGVVLNEIRFAQDCKPGQWRRAVGDLRMKQIFLGRVHIAVVKLVVAEAENVPVLCRRQDVFPDSRLCRFTRFGGCLLYTSPSPRD